MLLIVDVLVSVAAAASASVLLYTCSFRVETFPVSVVLPVTLSANKGIVPPTAAPKITGLPAILVTVKPCTPLVVPFTVLVNLICAPVVVTISLVVGLVVPVNTTAPP